MSITDNVSPAGGHLGVCHLIFPLFSYFHTVETCSERERHTQRRNSCTERVNACLYYSVSYMGLVLTTWDKPPIFSPNVTDRHRSLQFRTYNWKDTHMHAFGWTYMSSLMYLFSSFLPSDCSMYVSISNLLPAIFFPPSHPISFFSLWPDVSSRSWIYSSCSCNDCFEWWFQSVNPFSLSGYKFVSMIWWCRVRKEDYRRESASNWIPRLIAPSAAYSGMKGRERGRRSSRVARIDSTVYTSHRRWVSVDGDPVSLAHKRLIANRPLSHLITVSLNPYFIIHVHCLLFDKLRLSASEALGQIRCPAAADALNRDPSLITLSSLLWSGSLF